jgi:hypothetical protein
MSAFNLPLRLPVRGSPRRAMQHALRRPSLPTSKTLRGVALYLDRTPSGAKPVETDGAAPPWRNAAPAENRRFNQ